MIVLCGYALSRVCVCACSIRFILLDLDWFGVIFTQMHWYRFRTKALTVKENLAY